MNFKHERSTVGPILETSEGSDWGKPQNISIRIDGLSAEIWT